MSNTLNRAMGEGGERLQLRSEEESVRVREHKRLQSRCKKHSAVQLSPILSIPTDKMNKLQKHLKILKRFSESCPWMA